MTHDYHSLRVAAVRQETRDAFSLGLAVPHEYAADFHFKPGQHLPVRAIVGGEEVRRTYSITSGPADTLLWVTIKRVEGGVFSTWAHGALAAGSNLECMPPAGRLVLPDALVDGSRRRIVAVAAGSGITPLMSIIEHVLESEQEAIVTLVYGNRSVEDIIFRERLESLKNLNVARLQVLHVLSRDSEADVPLLAGRIDAVKLRRICGPMRISGSDDILLCGPDTLIKESRDVLVDLGAAKERVRFEYFRAGPQSDALAFRSARQTLATSAIEGTEAVALLDGVRRTFVVAEGQHIIDAATSAGLKLPYSCKGGMCCTCRAKLIEGSVVMDRNFSLQEWELQAGFVLTCQSRPTTPRIVLDYDAA